MIDDEQVSEAAQPIREHDPPRSDGAHFLPRRRANEQTLPRGPAAWTLGAEAVREHTSDRQPQPALQPRQGPFRAAGLGNFLVAEKRRGRDHSGQLLDEPRQAGFVALELLHLAALRAQLAGNARKHFAVLRLLLHEPGALGAPRPFASGDLGVPFPGTVLELFEAREARAQLSDELRLSPGDIAVVMHLARDAAGVLAREQKLQGALLPVEITQGEQSPEAFPARG